MKKNANKGFSLVELIIVIAIMAVLIGVLAPQFIKQVEKSRESTDLQNVEEIKTAIETLVAEKGDALTADIKITISGSGKTITVTNATDIDEYGVSNSATLKSGKWADIEWTYDCAKDGDTQPVYKWTASPTANSVGATYFHWDGSNV